MMNYDSLFTDSEDTLQKIEKMAILKDGEGSFFFPVTCTAGIYDMEGITLAERLKRLHDLAAQRQIVVLEDSTYDKTSLLSYLQSILSDQDLTGDSLAYVRLSNAETILFHGIVNADVIVFKFHDRLFIWLIDVSTGKRYHANIDNASITIGWQEEVTYSIDLEEEQKYVTKGYVDSQLNELTDMINEDIKKTIDSISTELSKVRIDMLQEIDRIIKAQNELNKNTYVSQTYFNAELEKIKEEINGSIDVKNLEKIVGNPENLETTDKSCLVSAINEVFQSGNNFKSSIRDTIIAKDESIIIPEKPTLNDLTSSIEKLKPSTYANDATAIAEDILTGKSAYTGDGLVEGVMPVNELSGTTITPGTANIIIPKGYSSENITVAGDADLIAENIMKGKDIFGVMGTLAASSGMQMASGSINNIININTIRNPSNTSFTIPINLSFNPSYVFLEISDFRIQTNTASTWIGLSGYSFFISNLKNTNIHRISSSSSCCLYFKFNSISSSRIIIDLVFYHYINSYYYLRTNSNWYAFGY